MLVPIAVARAISLGAAALFGATAVYRSGYLHLDLTARSPDCEVLTPPTQPHHRPGVRVRREIRTLSP